MSVKIFALSEYPVLTNDLVGCKQLHQILKLLEWEKRVSSLPICKLRYNRHWNWCSATEHTCFVRRLTNKVQMGASGAESQARSVLLGLGFSAEAIDQPMVHLSGGWQTRCSLASALCQSADLLLLDEPTNFLDLPSIIWLEHYIQNLPSSVTVLVVTHDRAFADGVADELLVMRNLGLERFRGNLSAYELERMKKFKYMSRMKDAQDKQKKHVEKTIEQNLKTAKRTGDDKKLKQAASRKKKLEERTGLEVSAKGGRFKLNRDLAGFHLTNRGGIEVPDFDPPVRFTVPTTPSDLRFPGALLSMEKVTYAYSTLR